MDYKNLNSLIISESNYSCEYLDEPYLKMRNNITKQIYQLDEKEKDIYEQQEEFGKKMLELISKNQKKFKHKYNKIQKQDDLYHKENNNFNDRIMDILNQYKNNLNKYNSNRDNYFNNGSTTNLNINPIFDVFDNKWIFPKKSDILNNKSFKAKCNLKSYDKKLIKTKTNTNTNTNNFLRKNYPRSKSKTYRKSTSVNPYIMNTNNNINNIKVNNNNKNITSSKKKISKTERKSNNEYNLNNKSAKKYRFREKTGTGRTTAGTDNNSIYEGNKFELDDKDDNNIIYDTHSNFDEKQNLRNYTEYQYLNKPDYSKYLTKQNFYPKSCRNTTDNVLVKERFSNDDEMLYETKTSFKNDEIMKDLYNRAFKKCEYQPNLCHFSDNYRNYVFN